jgi:HlyD family secretion protein
MWVFLVLLAGGGFAGWQWYKKQPDDSKLEYKTATLARGDLTQSVTANGAISPVKTVTIGSQVSGIITDIRVDFNTQVTNGQLIAQIDPSTYQQIITQLDADLANVNAAQELAELEYGRAQSLRKSELISQSDYDRALVGLHQAQAVVKMRAATLKKAQVDLERTTITSPIDGIVITRSVDVGQTVAASFNTPTLFTVANDLRKMRIEAMVSEADVGGVREGQNVNFSVDAYPGRQFNGIITQVRFAPITNQNVVNYTTIVEVNNDDLRLRPGMTATAAIIIAQKNNVLRIPNAALRFRPPEKAVVKGLTNAPAGKPAEATQVAASSENGGPPGGGGGGSFSSLSPEERRKRFESMSPEERERMRSMRGAGGGRAGGSRSSSGGPDGVATRTVYLLEKETLNGKEETFLKAVTIKTGMTDGTNTEVLEGLKEGDSIVSSLNQATTSTTAKAGTSSSPFGSPFGFRPR